MCVCTRAHIIVQWIHIITDNRHSYIFYLSTQSICFRISASFTLMLICSSLSTIRQVCARNFPLYTRVKFRERLICAFGRLRYVLLYFTLKQYDAILKLSLLNYINLYKKKRSKLSSLSDSPLSFKWILYSRQLLKSTNKYLMYPIYIYILYICIYVTDEEQLRS